MLLQEIINAVIQLVVFCIIPFIWWFAAARKKESFLSWLGLKTPQFNNKAKVLVFSFLILLLLLVPGLYLIFTFENKSLLASARFAGTGINGTVPILLFAVVQTGLSEEIFFRGFLGKRVSHKFGFGVGNTAQAIIFGVLHGVMLFGSVDITLVITTTAFALTAGWLMGYLNEKLSNGSIMPSWTAHSVMNIISSALFWLDIIEV